MLRLPIGVVIAFVFLVSPFPSFAQIKICKFSSLSGTDWVELCNDSAETEDLSSWQVFDLDDTNSKGGWDCFLAAGTSFSFSFGQSLNKDGDIINLKKNGQSVDCVSYGNKNCPSHDLHLEITADQCASLDNNSWGTYLLTDSSFCTPAGESSCISTPTPSPSPTGTPSPTSMPTNTSTSSPQDYDYIYLWEFMPAPEEGDDWGEWVELKNENDFSVTLEAWQIDDQEGASLPQTFSTTIASQGFFVLKLGASKLNNNGDTVRLINQQGTVKDTYTYKSSTNGKSWSKNSSSWCETDPSRAAANNSCLFSPTSTPTPTPSPTPSPSISPVSSQASSSESASPRSTGQVLGQTQEKSSPDQTNSSAKKTNPLPFIFLSLGTILLTLVSLFPKIFPRGTIKENEKDN